MAESVPVQANSYRPEIDGLRAVCVAAVILYHAEIPGFSGGFLGVDSFFAISGFLITRIIVRTAESGRFSLAGFYMRRIRRIIPALAVMCLLTLPLALWLMIPEDLENYGQSLFATGLSVNNVLLYLTSGYFELETSFKPLFHTWSLGAEEQYYVIVPLLLILAIRMGGRRSAFALLALASLASLMLCESIRFSQDEANFLLLPSRFWEPGLGGLTALAQPRLLGLIKRPDLRQSLAVAGLAMTIAGMAWLTTFDALPGWQSLFPVSGTCAVLAFADRSGVGRLLSARPVAGLGLISYSAYLYHLPLFVFVRIASLEPTSPIVLGSLIPVSLVLAWLSWRYVEQPFRDPARTSNRTVLLFCGGILTVTSMSGLTLHATSGSFTLSTLDKHNLQFHHGEIGSYNSSAYRFESRPFAVPGSERNVLVIGNSFARDFINMALASEALAERDISYAMLQNCDAWPASLNSRLHEAKAVVLGSGLFPDEIPCVQQKLAMLEAMHVPHIIVLGTKQFGYNNNAIMLLPEVRRYSFRARPLAGPYAANLAARQAIPGRYYVDLFAILDNGTGTVPVFTPEHTFISQDRKHLTSAGARFLGVKVFAQPQFSWLGKQGNRPPN